MRKLKIWLIVLLLVAGTGFSYGAFIVPANKNIIATEKVRTDQKHESAKQIDNQSVNTQISDESEPVTPKPNHKSQIVAMILCILLGWVGVHRFYLGYTWQGIVQILTIGGLGIWTLIDFIRIIKGNLKPKHSGYAKRMGKGGNNNDMGSTSEFNKPAENETEEDEKNEDDDKKGKKKHKRRDDDDD